jgi:hypothetical protein
LFNGVPGGERSKRYPTVQRYSGIEQTDESSMEIENIQREGHGGDVTKTTMELL